MTVRRWESDRRYYCALLYRDLFGDWLLGTAWGGRRSALGNWRCMPVADERAGLMAIDRIDKVRRRHGYHLVRAA